MNESVAKKIRESCAKVQESGIKIAPGSWIEFNGRDVAACDPLIAVLIASDKLPYNDPIIVKSNEPTSLSNPGYIRAVCQTLGVDVSFLKRFWMGFDQCKQATLVEKDKQDTQDDISAFGLELRKELGL